MTIDTSDTATAPAGGRASTEPRTIGCSDLVLICTITMHKVAREVQEHIPVPLLDIVEVAARRAGFSACGA